MYMSEMPSADFRRMYAKLTEPTVVTVNGHAIGVWTPSRQPTNEPPAVYKPVQRGESSVEATKRAQAERDALLARMRK